MNHRTHWHIITDCAVMGSYTTKEQAENTVYKYMHIAALALLRRWTRHLMDNGVVTYSIAEDEVESWVIEPCSRPLNECDPLDETHSTGGARRFGYLRRTGDDQW